MPYLIDGNNLAHALGFALDGRADRVSCARAVTGYCGTMGARATIVFDGPAPWLAAERPAPTHRVRVVFSESRTADAVILSLVGGAKAPRDTIVVTSDKPLGDRARHLGASILRCHEFARLLKARRSEGGGKPETRESPAEIEAWLEAFRAGPGRGVR